MAATRIGASIHPTASSATPPRRTHRGRFASAAPALAAADVSFAIGAGSDVAIEAADLTLVRNDLGSVADAISLSRATLGKIRQNLFFAFIYNALGVPVAAGVLYPFFGILLSPIIAAAAMALSSVSVITNAARLRRVKL